MELFLLENKSLTFEERKTESIFIGNIQCKEQKNIDIIMKIGIIY